MTNDKFYLVDTNTLISNPHVLEEYNTVISSHVLREIEHLELTRKYDRQLQYEIRQAKNAIDNNEHIHVNLKDYTFNLSDEWDKSYVDNILIQVCVENEYGIITNDKLLRDKAKLYNIEVIRPNIKKDYVEHKGFKIIDTNEIAHIENLINEYTNSYDLMVNEYAVINDDNGELLDIVKWTGYKTVSLKDDKGKLGQSITSSHFGTISPKDEFQVMAIDSILSNQVTVLRGSAGSGKSLLALHTAWQLVEREGYKLVIFVNSEPTKDSVELGYYKGDKLSKILQSTPTLESKFGDEFVIQQFIEEGKLELHTFSHLRGYDTGDNKVICWCVESQNLTIEHMRLGGQRLGLNTKWLIDGDFNTQIDNTVYERSNGMKRLSEVLRGVDLYGEIELQNVWRSRLAELLQKM